MENLLKQRLQQAKQALTAFQESLGLPYNTIAQEAAIKRCEFTYEGTWKTTRQFLSSQEGIQASSPKKVMRNSLQAGLLNADETAQMLQLIDDRNLTVHLYNETFAKKLYEKLPLYAKAMENLLQRIEERL